MSSRKKNLEMMMLTHIKLRFGAEPNRPIIPQGTKHADSLSDDSYTSSTLADGAESELKKVNDNITLIKRHLRGFIRVYPELVPPNTENTDSKMHLQKDTPNLHKIFSSPQILTALQEITVVDARKRTMSERVTSLYKDVVNTINKTQATMHIQDKEIRIFINRFLGAPFYFDTDINKKMNPVQDLSSPVPIEKVNFNEMANFLHEITYGRLNFSDEELKSWIHEQKVKSILAVLGDPKRVHMPDDQLSIAEKSKSNFESKLKIKINILPSDVNDVLKQVTIDKKLGDFKPSATPDYPKIAEDVKKAMITDGYPNLEVFPQEIEKRVTRLKQDAIRGHLRDLTENILRVNQNKLLKAINNGLKDKGCTVSIQDIQEETAHLRQKAIQQVLQMNSIPSSQKSSTLNPELLKGLVGDSNTVLAQKGYQNIEEVLEVDVQAEIDKNNASAAFTKSIQPSSSFTLRPLSVGNPSSGSISGTTSPKEPRPSPLRTAFTPEDPSS